MESATYSEARVEYQKQMANKLVLPLLEFFRKIRADLWAESQQSILSRFQKKCAEIPKWNQDVVAEETNRLIEVSRCDYLEELMTALFIAHTKVMASVRVNKKNKKLTITVPKLDHFLHRVFTEAAKAFWKAPFLFQEELPAVERQKNLLQAEAIIEESIYAAVRDMLPIKKILQEYISEPGDEDVEDEVKPAAPEEVPAPPSPPSPPSPPAVVTLPPSPPVVESPPAPPAPAPAPAQVICNVSIETSGNPQAGRQQSVDNEALGSKDPIYCPVDNEAPVPEPSDYGEPARAPGASKDYRYGKQHLALARSIYRRVRENPEADKLHAGDPEVWANELRIMEEVDGVDHKTQVAVLSWVFLHPHWQRTVQSPSGLRRQWSEIVKQYAERNKGYGKDIGAHVQ